MNYNNMECYYNTFRVIDIFIYIQLEINYNSIPFSTKILWFVFHDSFFFGRFFIIWNTDYLLNGILYIYCLFVVTRNHSFSILISIGINRERVSKVYLTSIQLLYLY